MAEFNKMTWKLCWQQHHILGRRQPFELAFLPNYNENYIQWANYTVYCIRYFHHACQISIIDVIPVIVILCYRERSRALPCYCKRLVLIKDLEDLSKDSFLSIFLVLIAINISVPISAISLHFCTCRTVTWFSGSRWQSNSCNGGGGIDGSISSSSSGFKK